MYALVEYSGKQFILREGEEIKIPFLDQKVGSKISFDNILLFNDGKNEKIGDPYVKSLNCQGEILSHGKDKKIIVFKKKRRKGYHKKNGHRQQYTLVKVDKFGKSTTKQTAVAKTKTTAKTTTTKAAVVKTKTTTKATIKKSATKKTTKKATDK